MSKILTTNEMKNSFFILIGTFFIALSVVFFFLPNNFTTGGTPGMAILLHHLSDFSIGTMVIAINIPLLIWGTKYLGKKFALKTIVTIILISIFIDLLTKFFPSIYITENIFLASVFGGILVGFGVGLIIKGNSSAGGSTIIARIVSSSSHIKPAQIILFIDVIIVVCSIYVFKDIEKALWSIISLYATSKSIDIILTGTLSTKVIHIATNKVDELTSAITKHLGEEGTVLKGSSLKTQDNKTLIFIVVDIKKIGLLKEIIQQTDEDAFMIVMEASEMLGRGH